MACLVPQFKCLPDVFAIHFTAHNHQFKARQPVCFRAQCLLTTTASMPTAMVVDMARLQLPSLEPHSHSVATDGSLTYMGSIGPPSKTSFDGALLTEKLTCEEALVAAAAAEAVALAKAAVEVAKNAASMIGYNPSTSLGHRPAKPESNDFWFERAGLVGTEQTIGPRSLEAATIPEEENSVQISTNVEENLDPTDEELKLLEIQLWKSVAVRSGRQTERKIKRSKAAEMASSSVVSVNTRTSSRRKKSAAQEVDYSDPLRCYKMVPNSKLLTANEEAQLSAGIQVLLKLEKVRDDLVERYGGDPTLAQWAAAAGVDQKTLRKSLNHGYICKDKMIKSNRRLVISIAKHFAKAGVGFDDLVQEGCRGLVRGAEKFDASKGFKFSTYAHWWIKQAVRKCLCDRARTIRLPFHMVEATYRVKEATAVLRKKNGIDPSVQELADETGLSMKRVQAVLLTPKAPKSIDMKIGIDGTLKLSDVTPDPNIEEAENVLKRQCMREDLDKVLGTLNSREKQVVRWRFGLEDGRMKTLQEIGEMMGVSRERIRQIESCAFRKLKSKKRSKNLLHYSVSS